MVAQSSDVNIDKWPKMEHFVIFRLHISKLTNYFFPFKLTFCDYELVLCYSKYIVCGLAETASLGSSLEMQICRSYTEPTELQSIVAKDTQVIYIHIRI